MPQSGFNIISNSKNYNFIRNQITYIGHTSENEAAAGELSLLHAGIDGVVRPRLPGYGVPKQRRV